MVVAEHEHRLRRRAGEVVEPLELLGGETAAVGAGPHGVEHRERDARQRRRRTVPVAAIVSVIIASWLPRTWCMRSPSREYARRNAAYSSSLPRLVRSPFTTTASGSSRSIASIAPRFITSGYGSAPGSALKIGPTSSGVPSIPQCVSPKCTSFTVANVASCAAGRRRERGDARGQQLATARPRRPASGYSVPGSRPVDPGVVHTAAR